MGATVSSAWRRIYGEPREMRAVMFGLDASGKTTILYRLRLGEVVTTIPTIGFNVESISHKGTPLTIWDLGLRSKARPMLRWYLTPPPDGIIFVVDSNDHDRMQECREFLELGLEWAREYSDPPPPLLVYVNKQDLPNALSIEQVRSGLGLDTLPAGLRVHFQLCCAESGEGLAEGLDGLMRVAGLPPGTAVPAAPAAPAAAAAAASAAAAGAPAEPKRAEPAFSAEDEPFLTAFRAGRGSGPRLGARDLLRLAYLHRARVPGAAPRVSFEAARCLGFVEHATRAWFWIDLGYKLAAKAGEHNSSLAFLEAHTAVLPQGPEEEHSFLTRYYSPKLLADTAAALSPMPPDVGDEAPEPDGSDEDFLSRVEACALEAGELSTAHDLARLAFVLLRRCSTRREAIARMDRALRTLAQGWQPARPSTETATIDVIYTPAAAGSATVAPETDGGASAPSPVLAFRPFHETRQYSTLQLVHAAMASRPEVASSFARLAAAFPDLADESRLLEFYSPKALEAGAETFVVPDVQPLPSVLATPSWHEDLDDASFLRALSSGELPRAGAASLARCAYLLLREGRRQGLEKLLEEVAKQRARSGAAGFGNDTLAYVSMHMVHFHSLRLNWALAEPFAAFAANCSQVTDPGLWRSFYSAKAMYSEAARTGLVLPDLCPLPNLVPSVKA